MYQHILLTVFDKIATIIFNRPEVGNAFAKESYREICDALAACAKDEAVGAIVLTGKGKHFSAGGDIKRFKNLLESKQYLQVETILCAGEMSSAVRACPKPVIAMINGAAAGAGCSIALACDFRIVTPKSKLVMSFINLGLSGDTGGMFYLQRLVGTAKTIELLMLGQMLDGSEALRLGLATKLVEPENLESETMAFASRLAHGPLVAYAKQKALMQEFFYGDLPDYTSKEAAYMVACSHSADFEEAVDAFLEKRDVKFCGR